MLRQIKLLLSLQLRSLFGINEIRHTKDKKAKRRLAGLALVWLMLIGVIVFYVIWLSGALLKIGLGEIVPLMLYAVTAVMILFFSVFRAGHTIFDARSYETLIPLPLQKSAIVVSRFLDMYVLNLGMSLIVMIPGAVICAVYLHPGIAFYAIMLLGTLLLPLVPMTIASILGMGISYVGARMKHKSLVTSALSILAVIAIVALSVFSSRIESITPEILVNVSEALSRMIGSIYPPAMWFSAAVQGKFAAFGFFTFGSFALFAGMVALAKWKYAEICSALHSTGTRSNYRMGAQRAENLTLSLTRRELKRFFASSIYVVNSMVGYILMVVAAAALLIMGSGFLEAQVGIQNIVSLALPYFLGLLAALNTPASCSISMEGKQWWILKSLPVKPRSIYNAKILCGLSVALPEYVISIILCLIAIKPDASGALWLIVLPLLYLVFANIMGLFVNLCLPNLHWESETQPVKQGASVLVSMVIAMLSAALPLFLLIRFNGAFKAWLMPATAVALVLLSGLFYLGLLKKDISEIN